MLETVQLDHLTEDEKKIILSVLDRNEKILKQETIRIKNLEEGSKKIFSRIESVKVRTGEWMKEVARPTFKGRRRGTDVVRRSVKVREEASIPYYEPTEKTKEVKEHEHKYTPNKGQHRRLGSSRKRAKNLSNEKQVQFAKENFIYEDENAIKMDEVVAKPDIQIESIPTIVIDQHDKEEETKITEEDDVAKEEPKSKSFEDIHAELGSAYGNIVDEGAVAQEHEDVSATEEEIKQKIENLQNEIEHLADAGTVIVPSNTPEKKIYKKIKRKGSSRRRKEGPILANDDNRNDIFSSPSADEKSQEITNIATELIDEINRNTEERGEHPIINEDVSYGLPDIAIKKQVVFNDDITVHESEPIESPEVPSPTQMKVEIPDSTQLTEDIFKSLDSILADTTTLTPESPNETQSPFDVKEDSGNEEKQPEVSILVTEEPSVPESKVDEQKSPVEIEEEGASPEHVNEEEILTSITKEIEKIQDDVEEKKDDSIEDKIQQESPMAFTAEELIDLQAALGTQTPELSGGSNPSSPRVNIIITESSPTHESTTFMDEDIDEVIQAAKDELEEEAKSISDSHESSDNPQPDEAIPESSPKDKRKKVKKVVKVVKKKVKKAMADITQEVGAKKESEEEPTARMSRRRTAVRKKVIRKKPADVDT